MSRDMTLIVPGPATAVAFGRRRGLVLLIALAAAAGLARAASQEPPVGITDLERRIGALQDEIAQAETRIEQLRADESRQVELLAEIGSQIAASEQLINALTRQIRAGSAEAARLRSEIEDLGGEITRLQEVVAAYIVGLYTHGRRRLLQTVLAGGGFADTVRRLKGVSIIARRQSEDVEQLAGARAERVTMDRRITRTLQELENSRTAQRRTRTNLETARAEAEHLRGEITRDREATQALRQQQEETLGELVRRLQEERRRLAAAGRPGRVELGGFPRMQGRLPWPLSSPGGRGEIVRGFGRQVGRDRTVTINPGIDILAPPGHEASIIAVHNGEVIHIGWMTFLGTVIVLDHGDNYATVYTNATQSEVVVGDPVPVGFPMAHLGTDMTPASGELTAGGESRLLRFMIYRAGEAVDPLPWLGGR